MSALILPQEPRLPLIVFGRYYGSETLYSGITGEPLTADIFIGVVYYQRLRQMVSDKYVSRSCYVLQCGFLTSAFLQVSSPVYRTHQ